MRADGSARHRLTFKGGANAVWSPDGKRIAFLRASVLLTVKPNGRGLRRVRQGDCIEMDCSVRSPAGRRFRGGDDGPAVASRRAADKLLRGLSRLRGLSPGRTGLWFSPTYPSVRSATTAAGPPIAA